MFPLDQVSEIQLHPQDFYLTERVPFTRDEVISKLPLTLMEQLPNERVGSLVFVHVETSGAVFKTDKVIELALVKCTFSLDRLRLLSIDSVYDGYQDPQVSIPAEVMARTGISDEMVRGKSLDHTQIQNLLSNCTLMVAHRASFVRPFFERCCDKYKDLPWACSFFDVDWSALGFQVFKLEYLLRDCKYFFDNKRGCNYALSSAFLMHIKPEAFGMLCNSAMQISYMIKVNADFELRDKFKVNGFRFDSDSKAWFIVVYGSDLALKILDILDSIVQGLSNKAEIFKFTAQKRYKA